MLDISTLPCYSMCVINYFMYDQNENLPKAFIFDIDGTLALRGNRSPYDWHKVGEDLPNMPVIHTLNALQQSGYAIIIFTGRNGVCREETLQWLKENSIMYNHFDMRGKRDYRKDAIVKREMLEKIKDTYYIQGIFDDRNQVVNMWRSLGLPCFQVAKGDF